ncbi:response regulator [Sediminibacterium roseum]|uniref:Response regulator n=1 Tax=Sediminibacterium roseum TaxID=1978412 RepID=A0ABW9ZU22_9BACT|nr:response regulator [Sediminibacterium roseum]NCI50643.1 response regulator [Sediminibacterium roseum]
MPQKFVLIDDDPDDRDLFKEALGRLLPGAELVEFTDGRKAVEWLSGITGEKLPAAIVMDYNMPHLTAPQLLDRLCENEMLTHIPKIVWSTAVQPTYFDNCKNKGALEYFIKPTTQEGLVWIVQQVIDFAGRA